MTPAALDALLSRAAALGATLDFVLEHSNGYIPVIVKWTDERRKTLCGPWSDLLTCWGVWSLYGEWRVFDYEISGDIVQIHIKEPMKGGAYGKGQTHS